jgi:hypothetical protein
MRTCDTCPGGKNCAAVNLHPILSRVHALYASGVTDKFDILFSLGEDNEALLEKYDDQVSKDCWNRAALLAIAGLLTAKSSKKWMHNAPALIGSAVAAFERFPWQVNELVAQAPELYREVCENDPSRTFTTIVSKRAFAKFCKSVAFAKKSKNAPLKD